MRDSDEVAVGRLGIVLSRKQARSLGLQENSRAWGQWVEARRHPEKMKLPEAVDAVFDPRQQGPHLVISNIHPDKWASVMRLEARLPRDSDAIARLLDSLRKMNLNILTIDSALGGFNLQIVWITFESVQLTAKIRPILDNIRRRIDPVRKDPKAAADRRHEARLDAFQQIGRRVLACCAAIEAQLCLDDANATLGPQGDGAGSGLFYRPARKWGNQAWFLDSVGDGDLSWVTGYAHDAGIFPSNSSIHHFERTVAKAADALERINARADEDSISLRCESPLVRDPGESDAELAARYLSHLHHRHAHRGITVQGLITLAHARIWRALGPADAEDPAPKPVPPVQFRYLNGTLHVEQESREHYTGYLQEQLANICGSKGAREWAGRWVGLASFDRDERAMRLRMLRPWFSREFAWELKFNYLLELREEQSASGVLWHLLNALREHADEGPESQRTHFVIERVLNMERTQTHRREVERRPELFENGIIRLLIIAWGKQQAEEDDGKLVNSPVSRTSMRELARRAAHTANQRFHESNGIDPDIVAEEACYSLQDTLEL